MQLNLHLESLQQLVVLKGGVLVNNVLFNVLECKHKKSRLTEDAAKRSRKRKQHKVSSRFRYISRATETDYAPPVGHYLRSERALSGGISL